MWHTGNLTTLNILSSLHRRFFPFDIETIVIKTRGKNLMTVKLWVKQALDKTRSCNEMHLHFTVAKVVTYSQQNILKHKLEFFTTSKTDSLSLRQKVCQKISVIKNTTQVFDMITNFKKWSSTNSTFALFQNLIFTGCVTCKIWVWNRPKMDFVSLRFFKSIF